MTTATRGTPRACLSPCAFSVARGSVLPVSATAADVAGTWLAVEQGRVGVAQLSIRASPVSRDTAAGRERAYNAHWVATS